MSHTEDVDLALQRAKDRALDCGQARRDRILLADEVRLLRTSLQGLREELDLTVGELADSRASVRGDEAR